MPPSSVVVHELNFARVAVFEAKHDAPIAIQRDRPEALPVTLQRVEPQARKIQRLRLASDIEKIEHTLCACSQRSVDPARVALVKQTQSTAAKTSDHVSNV